MLRAQGPLGSDWDDVATWNPESMASDAEINETAKLHHHGVYSSQHLLGEPPAPRAPAHSLSCTAVRL